MSELLEGTVTKLRGALCDVDGAERVYECQARGRLRESDTGESKPVAVGDRVLFTPIEGREGVIEEVLPRTTKLSRRAPYDPHTEQIIVTNVDQLVIVASVRKPPLTRGIIDRYIIAGESGGLDPVICINKKDLAQSPADYAPVAQDYRDMGYQVLITSAVTAEGLEQLRCVLSGKSNVLAGHSGVGKSTLLNALQPGLELRTGAVTTKGRHTTSGTSLLKLDTGGYVVDTPGIREFTLWDIDKRDVAQFFPQIWELSADCRMPDCVHMHEPQCAVKEAVRRGQVPMERYQSYVRIVTSTEQVDVPRATDVERPEEQVSRKQREPSRRRRRQRRLREAAESLAPDEDEQEHGR